MDVRVVIICSGELDSIKIDGEEMEGLSVIKHKPIPDWFVPSNDRSGWEGLIEEIRKKIDDNFSPKLIHTIRGIGYILKVDNE